MNTEKHTPTPWRLIKDNGEHCIVRDGVEDAPVVLGTSEWLTLTDEDAAFIVRAANSFDALLKAVELADKLTGSGDAYWTMKAAVADALKLAKGE